MVGPGITTWLSLFNTEAEAQGVTVQIMPEGGAALTRTLSLPAKARRSIALHDVLTPNTVFALLVHFDRAGTASLVTRPLSSAFLTAPIYGPSQTFCREPL